jgi:hypothetical protein
LGKSESKKLVSASFLKKDLLLKLNTFANFERPLKIDISELFFGRLKGYVDFYCHFLLLYI